MPGRVQTSPIPDEFIDPETHLRVVHLSRFANDYSGVIYFTYNTFSADSRYALIDAQFADKWRYLYTFDFQESKVQPLVTDKLTYGQAVHPKSGNVYYLADHAAWVVPLTGGTPKKICDIPKRYYVGVGLTVNADESLLLSGSVDSDPSVMRKGSAAEINNGPNVLYTIDLKSGEFKVIHRDNRWFGHVQFSPTDPDMCMFCHEGTWGKVDRIWFINPSKSHDENGEVKSNARIAFHRTEAREMAGHEFWQPDGKAIWFQHSYPARSKDANFLTKMDVETGKTINYTVPRGFGGIHETFSPDGTFMVADGSAPKGINKGPGKYLSKLTIPTDGSTTLIGEHLATLQENDYTVEPNPHVSPDNRWVIFTATLHGTAQAYAVEMPQKK